MCVGVVVFVCVVCVVFVCCFLFFVFSVGRLFVVGLIRGGLRGLLVGQDPLGDLVDEGVQEEINFFSGADGAWCLRSWGTFVKEKLLLDCFWEGACVCDIPPRKETGFLSVGMGPSWIHPQKESLPLHLGHFQ